MGRRNKEVNPEVWRGLVTFALVGFVLWGFQVIKGMGEDGLNQQVVWGLYIAAFFTVAGAAARLLGLVGLSEFYPVIAEIERSGSLRLAFAR